jgi:hypothetical protein
MNNLQGFLLSVYASGDFKLEVEVDISRLKEKEYQKFVEKLQDLLSSIDRTYAIRRVRGGKRIQESYKWRPRLRVLRFSPFPSRYTTIMKQLRAEVYSKLLPSTCFIVEQMGNRNVFFLPKGRAPYLFEEVEKINKEKLARVSEDIREFTTGEWFLKIKELLKSYGIDPSVLDARDFSPGKLSLSVVPIDFSYSVDSDSFFTGDIREKHKRGLEALRIHIEEKHREYLDAILKEIESRVKEIISARRFRGGKKKLSDLIDICEGAGLGRVNEALLKPLMEICTAMKANREGLSERYFGTRNLSEGVEKTIRQLL